MSSNNSINIVGNLTRDPEMKYTPAGDAVCSFSVAVKGRTKDPATGEYLPVYFNCTVWRKKAEFVSQYLKKGRCVSVAGSMASRKYTNKEGQQVTAWELNADDVESVGPRPAEDNAAEGDSAPDPTRAAVGVSPAPRPSAPASDTSDEADPFADE